MKSSRSLHKCPDAVTVLKVLRRRSRIRVAGLRMVGMVVDYRSTIRLGRGHWHAVITSELDITRLAVVASVTVAGFVTVQEEAEDGGKKEENAGFID